MLPLRLRTRLWTQLLAAVLVATCLSVATEALLSYHSSRSALEAIAEERARENAGNCLRLLNQRGDQQLALVQSWSVDPRIDAAARRGDSAAAIVDAAQRLLSAGGIDTLKVYARDGTMIGSSGEFLDATSLWESPPVVSARQGVPAVSLVRNHGGLWTVSAAPILAADLTGPTDGLLVGASRVDSAVARLLATGGSDGIAVVSNRAIVATSDPTTTAAARATLAAGDVTTGALVTRGSADLTFTGLDAYGQDATGTAGDTMLVVATSRQAVADAEARLLRDVLLALVAALGIALVTATFLGRRITEPLRSLREALRAAGDGDLGRTAMVRGDDEITDLARAFNLTTRRLAAAHEALRDAATRDSCTGLLNHGELFRRLDGELARADREGWNVSMLMIDVDNFKQINDELGHLTGDAVLRRVADIVSRHARLGDTVARYGGDEFVLVLASVDAMEAVGVADRLRGLSAAPTDTGDPSILYCTLSIGIATRPPWGVSALTLVEAADEALLQAKREGRDRTTLHAAAPR